MPRRLYHEGALLRHKQAHLDVAEVCEPLPPLEVTPSGIVEVVPNLEVAEDRDPKLKRLCVAVHIEARRIPKDELRRHHPDLLVELTGSFETPDLLGDLEALHVRGIGINLDGDRREGLDFGLEGPQSEAANSRAPTIDGPLLAMSDLREDEGGRARQRERAITHQLLSSGFAG